MSLYTFGTTFNKVIENESDLHKFKSMINTQFEVEPSYPPGAIIGPAGGDGWTYTDAALRIANSSIKNVGEGKSKSSRQTYVIFMTDGLDSYPPFRTFGPRYAQECRKLKDRATVLEVKRFLRAMVARSGGLR